MGRRRQEIFEEGFLWRFVGRVEGVGGNHSEGDPSMDVEKAHMTRQPKGDL